MKLTEKDIHSASSELGIVATMSEIVAIKNIANKAIDSKKPFETELMIMSFYENDVSPAIASSILNRFNRYSRMTREEVQKEIDKDEYWATNCDIEVVYLARRFELICEAVYQVICSNREM